MPAWPAARDRAASRTPDRGRAAEGRSRADGRAGQGRRQQGPRERRRSSTQGTQGPVPLLLLRQEPGAGPQAHRGPGRLHLRRVHQPLPGDHRGGDARDAEAQAGGRQAPEPAPDQGRPRPVRHQPGAGQEGPLGRRLQPLQAGQRRPRGRRGRAPEVERPARRARPAPARRSWPRPSPASWTSRSASPTRRR